MPGASFKRRAREWRAIAERFYTIPFDFVKESMKEGTAKSSFTSLALRDISEKDDRDYLEELIMGIGGTVYIGGLSLFFMTIKLTSRSTAGADTVQSQHVLMRAKLIRANILGRIGLDDFLPCYVDEPRCPNEGTRRDRSGYWQRSLADVRR